MAKVQRRRLVTEEMRWAVTSLHQLLQSVSCETRLELLALLVHKPRTVTDLAAAMGRSIPDTSRHLASMREEGLVTYERRKQEKHFSLSPRVRFDIDSAGVRFMVHGKMGTAVMLGLPLTVPKLITETGEPSRSDLEFNANTPRASAPPVVGVPLPIPPQFTIDTPRLKVRSKAR